MTEAFALGRSAPDARALNSGRVPKDLAVEDYIAALHEKYRVEDYCQRALDRKLRLRTGPAYAPLSAMALAETLRRFLEQNIDGDFEMSELTPLTGGLSKEQYWFTLGWQERGMHHSRRLVLRTQPPQSAAETHRLREFQLLAAFQGVLPTPEPLWVDAEGEAFDNPTMIYAFVEGVSKPAAGLTDVRTNYGPYRDRLAPQFVEMLARIHMLDCATSDLSAFLIPPVGSNAGVHALIDWWARVWEEDSVEPNPLVSAVEQWLRKHAPPIDRVSVTHGDYRSTNFLFSLDTGDITAVLDWELAWIGDRHFDLAYALQDLFTEPGENGETLICGLMTRELFLGDYERRSGLSVDPKRLAYYELLAGWRNAVTTLAGGGRCVVEQKTHQDVSFAWFVPLAGNEVLKSLRQMFEARLADANR